MATVEGGPGRRGLAALLVAVLVLSAVSDPVRAVDPSPYCDEYLGNPDCEEALPDPDPYCEEYLGEPECLDALPDPGPYCDDYLGDPDCVPEPGMAYCHGEEDGGCLGPSDYCEEYVGEPDCLEALSDPSPYCDEYLGDPECVPEETIGHLLRSIAEWDPLRDGFPNPTLDCNALVPIPFLDTDGDGTPDVLDEDDDCDHISDELEQKLGLQRLNSDSDGDGIPDHRDMMPLTKVTGDELAVAVRAVSVCIENVLTGPSDGLTFDDPYLADTAGLILRQSSTPDEEHRFVIKTMTEAEHFHNADDCYDYSGQEMADRQGVVKLYQDILHDEYRAYDSQNIPKIRVNLPLRDHDQLCQVVWVGRTAYPSCPPGHPYLNENTEDDEEFGKPAAADVTWTLLSLAMAADKSMSTPELKSSEGLSVDPVLEFDWGGSPAIIKFRVEIGTNAARCGILAAAVAAPLDGTSDYITVADYDDKEAATDVTCPNV